MTRTDIETPSDNNKNWYSILEFGRYAPTPHNTQWYFLHPIDDTTAIVGIDASIQLPYTDPDDQFRFTGLGVFVRHLELSAEAVGFNLKSDFNHGDKQYPVTVQITAKHSPNDKLAKLITWRQTSRLAYKKVTISDEAVQALTALTNSKNSVHISTDTNIVNSILKLNNIVLLNDLREKGVGNELDTWIRYSKRSQAEHPTGFTPETLATSVWKVWLIFKFRKIMLNGPFKKWLTSQYFKQNMTATVGWLYGPLLTRQNQYDAGRFMMDLWMKASEHGYYIQPYGSIITNHEARKIFLADINQIEENNNMVWLAFRIGTSDKPARSPRKPIQEYIR
jgi:hypothetical protein